MGNELVYSKSYDEFNIVARTFRSLSLFDKEGNQLKTISSDSLLRMTTDNNHVYVLIGDSSFYIIAVYDFALNQIERIPLPNMSSPQNYGADYIVAANRRIMFNSPNTGGSYGHRMGFIDLNKGREVHYVDIKQTGSSCYRFMSYYDKATDSFYTKDGIKILKLNENTYEWEDTGATNFKATSPCSSQTYQLSFINGINNGIYCDSYGEGGIGAVTYGYNNREGFITYNDGNGNMFNQYCMLNENKAFVYGVANSLILGAIEDFKNEIVTVKSVEGVKTGRYGLYPMFKHPYKNIILIPISNSTNAKIMIYDYDNDAYSIFDTGIASTNAYACNAVTVPKQ